MFVGFNLSTMRVVLNQYHSYTHCFKYTMASFKQIPRCLIISDRSRSEDEPENFIEYFEARLEETAPNEHQIKNAGTSKVNKKTKNLWLRGRHPSLKRVRINCEFPRYKNLSASSCYTICGYASCRIVKLISKLLIWQGGSDIQVFLNTSVHVVIWFGCSRCRSKFKFLLLPFRPFVFNHLEWLIWQSIAWATKKHRGRSGAAVGQSLQIIERQLDCVPLKAVQSNQMIMWRVFPTDKRFKPPIFYVWISSLRSFSFGQREFDLINVKP